MIAFASPQGRWVLVVCVLASATVGLEATIVNVALPAIGDDLDAEVGALQWVLNGYLLTLAGLILLGGSLGDRLGRRRVFTIGTAWFTGASLLCALAPNVEVLIAARVFQGIGGALMTPASLAILEAVIEREDRARAIGAWSALGGVAGAVGPLLGGWLVDAVSWRAAFVLVVPLGLVAVIAGARHVPETRDPEAAEHLDLPGSALATLALAGSTFAVVQAADADSALPIVVAGAIGVVAAIAFLVTERRSPAPMLPLEIFRSHQFSAANALTFVVYSALGGMFFLFVVMLQVVLGYSPVEAGAASLPITVLMLLLSARAGALAARIGPRIPLTVGPLLIAGGMLLLAQIEAEAEYLTGVLPGVVVFGLGLSATVAPITSTALAATDDRHAGIASGVNNAVARTAQLSAVALLPLLAGLSGSDFRDPDALLDGFQTAMLITAAIAVAGAVLAWFTIEEDVLDDEPIALDCPPNCAVAGTPLRSVDALPHPGRSDG